MTCVTIFTSIPNIAEALRVAAPHLTLLQVIQDDALSGYGGTVEFDPSLLTETTRDSLQQAEILIAEPAVLARLLQHDASLLLANLKWCQSTYAGVDPLFDSRYNLQMPLSFQVTRFAGKFGPPIAEWCLARIIEHERNFASMAEDQMNSEWAGHKEVTRYRYLRDLTLSILGCGDIGLTISKTTKTAFGMRVVGFGKSPRDKHPKELDVYTTDLSHALCQADYVVSILPSTPDTRGLLSKDALCAAGIQAGGKSPVFLNVGRGDVIDEASLLSALDQKWVSAAILDVFEVEPLPKESRLWGRPDVVVSPHVSGVTRAEDVPDVFLQNYERYRNDKELLYQVDWSKGY